METIEELFRKVLDDEDLRASFGQALEGDRLEVFLRENGCEAAPSEVREALEGRTTRTKRPCSGKSWATSFWMK